MSSAGSVAGTIGKVEFADVWKKFHYGEVNNRLRDAIPALAAQLFGRRDDESRLWQGEFWALQSVSFEVQPGESLGIIGPNGAGKSTILKLLTRILRPTSGRCALQGRVGALIEVAAGFHPDLTGRENVFLQGAIMGMPRRQIARSFDEIVAFAGVDEFIDTPVKRYSSGMQARLGFSIAAHLDPDVLVIDEVLAVGDAAFQQKAFDRVTVLVKRHIPVVVVSHQLESITTLCTQALLLDRGHVVRYGTPHECITAYLGGAAGVKPARTGDGVVRIESLSLSHAIVSSGERTRVRLDCVAYPHQSPEPEVVRVRVRSAQSGEVLFQTGSRQLGVALPGDGAYALEFELQLNVARGVYLVESYVWDELFSRERFRGPLAHVEVRGAAEFDGPIQMNARLRLLTEESAAGTHA